MPHPKSYDFGYEKLAMKNVAILVGVPLAVWALLSYPGWMIWGEASIRHAGVALALCLVPAVVTFVAINRYAATSEQRLTASMGSTALRMAVALGGGLALNKMLPELFPSAFMGWLTVFYLLVLGLEVGLIVRQPPNSSQVSQTAGPNETKTST